MVDTYFCIVGTRKFYTYPRESVDMNAVYKPELEQHKSYNAASCRTALDALVTEIIGRIADKWTLVILEVLTEHGELRFTRLGEMVEGISQKMLTKTIRQMERDGLVIRTIHPVIPPRVEYKLTDIGMTLSAAFCGVWMWAAEHHERLEQSRQQYDQRLKSQEAIPSPKDKTAK